MVHAVDSGRTTGTTAYRAKETHPVRKDTKTNPGATEVAPPPDTTTDPTRARPTLATSRDGRARFNADNNLSLRMHALHDTVPAHGADPTHGADPAHHPVPPVEPTDPTTGANTRPTPTREQLDKAIEAANGSGDLSELNEVDPFRQGLPPNLQEEYDRRLEQVRGEVRSDQNPDGRIQFNYTNGATQDAATQDLALRGIVAASFGQPGEIERALERGAEGDNGALDIEISGANDLDPNTPGTEIGFAHRDSDIQLTREGFLNSVTGGGNTAIHEFSHVMQLGGQPESNFSDYGILPPNASPEDVEKFKKLYGEAYGVDTEAEGVDSVHFYTTAQNDFRLHPEELQERSPELYKFMADQTGFDPIAGTRKPTALEQIGGWLNQGIDRITDFIDEHIRGRDLQPN